MLVHLSPDSRPHLLQPPPECDVLTRRLDGTVGSSFCRGVLLSAKHLVRLGLVRASRRLVVQYKARWQGKVASKRLVKWVQSHIVCLSWFCQVARDRSVNQCPLRRIRGLKKTVIHDFPNDICYQREKRLARPSGSGQAQVVTEVSLHFLQT